MTTYTTRESVTTSYSSREDVNYLMTQDLDFLMTQDDNYLVLQDSYNLSTVYSTRN